MLAVWQTGILFQRTVALTTVSPAFMSSGYHEPVSLGVKQLEHHGLECM